jgi:hypothetical protein
MYRDSNGKTGYKMLIGTSGMTYGNLKNLPSDELASALADGISEYIAPPRPEPTDAQVLAQQTAAIKGQAESDINDILTLDERIQALADAVDLLDGKNNGRPDDPGKEVSLKADLDAIKAIRDQAALDIAAL